MAGQVRGRPRADGCAQLVPGHVERADAVQLAFLLLVAGNAATVDMLALVRARGRGGGRG